MSDCISCGLYLSEGVPACPACGAEQVVRRATVDRARCSAHLNVQADGTCTRCGRFTCVVCQTVDTAVCRTCAEVKLRDLLPRLEAVAVRSGWVVVVQGLLAAAISYRSGELFFVMAGLGGLSLVSGLLTVAHRDLWTGGLVSCGLIGFLSFVGLFDAPLLLVCIALTVVECVLLVRAAPLAREARALQRY